MLLSDIQSICNKFYLQTLFSFYCVITYICQMYFLFYYFLLNSLKFKDKHQQEKL